MKKENVNLFGKNLTGPRFAMHNDHLLKLPSYNIKQQQVKLQKMRNADIMLSGEAVQFCGGIYI